MIYMVSVWWFTTSYFLYLCLDFAKLKIRHVIYVEHFYYKSSSPCGKPISPLRPRLNTLRHGFYLNAWWFTTSCFFLLSWLHWTQSKTYDYSSPTTPLSSKWDDMYIMKSLFLKESEKDKTFKLWQLKRMNSHFI